MVVRFCYQSVRSWKNLLHLRLCFMIGNHSGTQLDKRILMWGLSGTPVLRAGPTHGDPLSNSLRGTYAFLLVTPPARLPSVLQMHFRKWGIIQDGTLWLIFRSQAEGQSRGESRGIRANVSALKGRWMVCWPYCQAFGALKYKLKLHLWQTLGCFIFFPISRSTPVYHQLNYRTATWSVFSEPEGASFIRTSMPADF